ncbi:DUF2793 domain-containing protein [Aminobacter sp. HY435]|uniref:DUF2793 domain-containing protein n=1 Tax=Aminobacter sp. HY435 TaxID=2970917 RepID=UPI0022B972AE|nr:DUF2793 domain-containing protein [Aminobacter sp. HY435]
MEQTTNLKLPFIMPSQAQKHVTHNEALLALDAVVQLSALDRHLVAPPATPAAGDRYIVAAAATGAWAGKSGQIAVWQDGTWTFYIPLRGWLAWVADEQRIYVHDGSNWLDAVSLGINPAAMVGINTTADATNRLSVKSQAVLFDNQGAGQQVKINKATSGENATLLFQTTYSGRAEFGLAGDDDWHVKVSPDGTAWTEALKVNSVDGRVLLPAGLSLTDQNQAVAKRHVREMLTANRTYYVRANGSDSNNGLANTAGGALLTIQKAYDVIVSTLDVAGHTVTIQVGAGSYGAGLTVSKGWTGAGEILLVGDETTPANVEVTAGVLVSITNAVLPAALKVRGFKHTSSQQTIVHNGVGALYLRNLVFNSTGFAHIQGANSGAKIWVDGNYSISSAGSFHYYIGQQAGLQLVTGVTPTVTLTGTLAFTCFAGASDLAMIRVAGVSYNVAGATVTGARYSVIGNAAVTTSGGAAFFPGSAAGSASSGGQYA